ncbi:MAG: hypothetical protein HBSAPP02_30910 [Phycisphaerae bacterium]|nr:MAG: hypothetical protein HBSAPP02_30910 [Phycisphaerae bacterium]
MKMRQIAIAAAAVFAAVPARAGMVNMNFLPSAQVVNVGATVSIDILLQADGIAAESVSALDAILDWDPTLLQLNGVNNAAAGYAWLAEGFLPDPDGINASLTDGNAIYTALGQLASPAFAPPPPGSLVVTTLEFTALAETAGTLVRFVPNMGMFGSTQIYAGFVPNTPITGDISSTALVTIIPEPASVACLLLAFQLAIVRWGRISAHQRTCTKTV